jgi:hypothetical protein
MVDSDFYPHPDIVRPLNRIRAWVDATTEAPLAVYFDANDDPRWPGWDAGAGSQWAWHDDDGRGGGERLPFARSLSGRRPEAVQTRFVRPMIL